MKKQFVAYAVLLFFSIIPMQAQLASDNRFSRPLGAVLTEIADRFDIRLKYDVDTAGLVLPYADSRIRPYSLEETLQGVLAPFDFKAVKQNDRLYKIKSYEYARRTPADGEKLLAYLQGLYPDRASWEARRGKIRTEVRAILGIDSLLAKCVSDSKPILSKVRKHDGYTVRNFALETLPGLYVCGSIYAPARKGKLPLIICPNGHFGDGRYRKDQQQRMGVLARMGAVCVDYDLFGWGESALQVGGPAHRSSMAHVMQALNGVRILDYMLTQKNIDATRIGVNGGSGGGTQAVLLTTIDDRYTASAPVVSLSSWFDGGCPCESGLPIHQAVGGTCNAEMAATFAPLPMLLVSDGKDWTSTTPELEYPYLQKIYGYYGATDRISNVHLPAEGHDFGINKREAVYRFFAEVFALDSSRADEAKVTIEPQEALLSFGTDGELLPEGAIRSASDVVSFMDKELYFDVRWAAGLEKKARDWTASLQLGDPAKENKVRTLIFNHLRSVTAWHNSHPYTTIPAGINPRTGQPLTQLDREIIAVSAQPKEYHEKLMKGLRECLTEEQVEAILDKYTVGKVAFTLKGYHAIVPNMTAEEDSVCLSYLKEARERAIDFKSMKQISEIFGIYKDKCEAYFNTHGRNWRQMYSDYYKKIVAEKKAKQKKQQAEKAKSTSGDKK